MRRQVDAGVYVVNDGEAGKIGYSTYVKERLTGFGGDGGFARMPADRPSSPTSRSASWGGRLRHADLRRPTPRAARRGRARHRQPQGRARRRRRRGRVHERRLARASSRIFLRNEHYPSHEAYFEALAEAMKTEYDAIHQAGFVLQLDCPDLAMTRHMQFGEDRERRSATRACNVEALNHATRDIPTTCACTCAGATTRARTTTTSRCARSSTSCFQARPSAISLEAATRGTSTSGRCSRTSSCPRASS